MSGRANCNGRRGVTLPGRAGRACLLLLTLLASLYCHGAGLEQERPNIVIVVADDLGWADVGFHGSPIETPNLDRLASEGMELSRFYTTPSCSPTRAALMTGRNAFRLGIAYATIMPWSNNGVHPEERFMPEAFRDAGYQTAMFGKWHLGHAQQTYHPNQRGFDHFYGHLHTEVGFYPPFASQGGKDFQRNGVSVDDQGYETFLLVEEASRWLDARDSEPAVFHLPALSRPPHAVGRPPGVQTKVPQSAGRPRPGPQPGGPHQPDVENIRPHRLPAARLCGGGGRHGLRHRPAHGEAGSGRRCRQHHRPVFQ